MSQLHGMPASAPTRDRGPIAPHRMASIDALRGLAMLLIISIDIGGAPVLPALAKLWDSRFGSSFAEQFRYEFVEGLRVCFLAMPMFLFVVGLVIPISLNRRRARGVGGERRIYLQIVRRSLILFLLGLIAGGHLLELKFAHMPLYNNVLEYIAVGYLVCAVVVLNTAWPFQLALALTLLTGYWLLFQFVPVPGWDGGIYSADMNLAIYVDNAVLGPFHRPGSWQVLATISFIANVLLGVLMGQVLEHTGAAKRKIALLSAAGTAMLAAGLVWAPWFPVIRSLWTSSYVLVTCGLTTLLLAAFVLLIDLLGHRRSACALVVLGANSIAIYMMAHLFDFRLIGNIVVGGISELCAPDVRDLIQACAALTVMWLIMYWMYRTETFVRV